MGMLRDRRMRTCPENRREKKEQAVRHVEECGIPDLTVFIPSSKSLQLNCSFIHSSNTTELCPVTSCGHSHEAVPLSTPHGSEVAWARGQVGIVGVQELAVGGLCIEA